MELSLRRFINCLFYSFVFATLCACGGSGDSAADTDNGGSGGGNIAPVLQPNLIFSGNQLPEICEFDDGRLRNFAQCDLTFEIQLAQGNKNDASFAGQVSTNGGDTWQNLSTSTDLTFSLPVAQYSGGVQIRATMSYQQMSSQTQALNFTLLANSINMLDSGDFAQDKAIYLDPLDFDATHISLTLPTCVNEQQDLSKVILHKNNRYFVEQKAAAQIKLQRSRLADNDTLTAVCIDDANAAVQAPGQIQIRLQADPSINHPPIVSFSALPQNVQKYQSLIRDAQSFDVCIQASDEDNDELAVSLQAQTASKSIDLNLNDEYCATLNTETFAGENLSLFATANDGTDTAQATYELGQIYPDTLPVISANNSSCQLEQSEQKVNLDLPRDTEFDDYQVQVVNVNNGQVLRDLGQVNSGETTSAQLSFSCDQLGQTQYQIVTQSRGKQVSSQTYSHSVTAQVNQLPELKFEIDGDVLTLNEQAIQYRDNQLIEVCVIAEDADNDVLTYSVNYQWAQMDEMPLLLNNDCGQIDTQGRGGQQLKLIGQVDDGSAEIQKITDLAKIHSDTIQFAASQSQSCTVGDPAVSYSVNVKPDSEGDNHQLTVINADTQAVIKNLGSVTSGQFDLACDEIGSTAFQLKNQSRELTAISNPYLHTVTASPNEKPTLEYQISGTKFNEQFRDNSTLEVCLESSDPEGMPVELSGEIIFKHPSNSNLDVSQELALDSQNCMPVSTFNKGGYELIVDFFASDGVTEEGINESQGFIHQDQINIAKSDNGECTEGSGFIEYVINIEPDIEGDSHQLTVIDIADNSVIASSPVTDTQASFSLSCQNISHSKNFYIRNDSRGLSTYSLVYRHQVDLKPNTAPELELNLIQPALVGDNIRDNQSFDVCLAATDADGDNLTLSLAYQIDEQAEQTVTLNNGCGTVSTFGAGGKTLVITATANDGRATATANPNYQIHADSVQFAFTSNQSCAIGDSARVYQINLADDLEGDEQNVTVYRADNTVLRNLGQSRSFSLSCNTGAVTEFYLVNESRGLSTRSLNYQHVVSNQINTRPTINLSVLPAPGSADIARFGGQIRDQQSLQICADVNDAETPDDQLNVQVFYRFDNQALQTLSLNQQCGLIDLTNRGEQNLVVQGFAGDGTETGNQDLNLGTIHKDTIQAAISNSGTCRVGDENNDFIVRVSPDLEGDEYNLDVIDLQTGDVLVELDQITAGNFSLPCNELGSTNFVIRTTSRGLTQNSIVYSHVVDNTLNSNPRLSLNLVNAQVFGEIIRDAQTLQVCLSATDSDNDPITYRAVYQFTGEQQKSLSLNEQQCGFIDLTNRGNDSLIIQGFADDGIAESSQLLEINSIHQDTLATPQTVSSSCSIGESSLIYSIDLADDAENDLRQIQVKQQPSNNLIAQFDESDDLSQFDFSLPCEAVGETLFTLTAISRNLEVESDIYSHKVNPSLTNVVQVWMTTADQSQLLAPQADLTLRAGMGTATNQIDVSDSMSYQNIQGFGAGLTDSAASLIFESENSQDIVSRLFEPEQGAGLNRVRISLSGLGEYVARAAQSYDDMPSGLTDPDLTFFSTEADDEYFIPVLNSILQQNDAIKVDAVSWSAPGWMKNTDSLNGGSLRLEFYDEYAKYLSKSLQAYQTKGIEIASFSLQNQPHLETNYPSMLWDNTDYQIFFEDFLFPQFQVDDINSELWVWDGNWTDYDSQQEADIALFATDALNNDFIYGRAFGVALQCYQANNGSADVAKAITQITSLTRARPVYLTSCRNQNNGRTFAQYLTDTSADMIMPFFEAGASGIMLDNLILDSDFGPYQNGCTNCRALLTKQSDGEITENAEFYAFAHFSRFIQTGAKRIESSQINGVIRTQAFKNPDNSIVLVLVNQANSEQPIDINWQGQSTLLQLPALSVATLTWNADNSGVADLQKIQQASQLAQDSLSLVNAMRTTSGLYAEHLNFDLGNMTAGAISPAATGVGLVALSIEHQMQWNTNATSLVLATLETLLAENDEITPARDDFGIFAKRLAADGSEINDNYSILETAYLLAGAKFAQNVFNNSQINEKVDLLFESVDWQGVIESAEQGIVIVERDFAQQTLATQGVYDQQMLVVWLAKQAGLLPAKTLWDNYYANGELANKVFFNDFAMPADNQGESISATIHQLNYYLINPVLASANYRQLFASHAQAEQDYWLTEYNQASYVWGFGYGTDNSQAQPQFNSLTLHNTETAHAPTIAGFIPANNDYLDDLLTWQTNDIGILTTSLNNVEVPWRYQINDINWQAERLDMLSLAPLFMGISAHSGLLDIQFYRLNNQVDLN